MGHNTVWVIILQCARGLTEHIEGLMPGIHRYTSKVAECFKCACLTYTKKLSDCINYISLIYFKPVTSITPLKELHSNHGAGMWLQYKYIACFLSEYEQIQVIS